MKIMAGHNRCFSLSSIMNRPLLLSMCFLIAASSPALAEVYDRARTPLCNPATPDALAGRFTWTVHSGGAEEVRIDANLGETPPDLGTTVELTVNSQLIGFFEADRYMTLHFRFASPGVTSPPWLQPLPLPDTMRPVSSIDSIILSMGGQPVVEGSFSAPCAIEELAVMCPHDGAPEQGEVWRTIFPSGEEDLFFSFTGLPEGALEVAVDGHSVYQVDRQDSPVCYQLRLTTLSDVCDSPWWLPYACLQLPPELRPVTDIDMISLRVGDSEYMAGSFEAPCAAPARPELTNSESTPLCPIGHGWYDENTLARVAWWLYDSGDQYFEISADDLDPQHDVELYVDHLFIGVFQVHDEYGNLHITFASEGAQRRTCTSRPPFPAGIAQVDGIRQVALRQDGRLKFLGKFGPKRHCPLRATH